MIMKKVISAMAIAGVLATSGAVMAAPNSTDQAAAANKPKAAVEASAQNQHQYKKGSQDMNKFQHKYQNGSQTQEKGGDCTQDQTQTQTQTQDQSGK